MDNHFRIAGRARGEKQPFRFNIWRRSRRRRADRQTACSDANFHLSRQRTRIVAKKNIHPSIGNDGGQFCHRQIGRTQHDAPRHAIQLNRRQRRR